MLNALIPEKYFFFFQNKWKAQMDVFFWIKKKKTDWLRSNRSQIDKIQNPFYSPFFFLFYLTFFFPSPLSLQIVIVWCFFDLPSTLWGWFLCQREERKIFVSLKSVAHFQKIVKEKNARVTQAFHKSIF